MFVYSADQVHSLHQACLEGQPAKVRKLLTSGSDPNEQDRLDRCGLHIACQKMNVAILNLLLQYKADAEIPNEEFQLPIHVSCASGMSIFMPLQQCLRLVGICKQGLI